MQFLNGRLECKNVVFPLRYGYVDYLRNQQAHCLGTGEDQGVLRATNTFSLRRD